MCLTPIFLKKETAKQRMLDSYFMQEVPCGRCLECRKLRTNSWYVRLKNEMSESISAIFLTLTYDDPYLPYTNGGHMSLYYPDLQKFIKRLRKRNDKKTDKKLTYFAVGEYGSQTFRPHYHLIIFNISDISDIGKSWVQGHHHIGEVNDKSIFYTLKYVTKRVGEDCERDPSDDRIPEKALQSKGIGLNFLTPQMIKYYNDDVSRCVTMLGNKKIGLPRYYRDKIFSDSQKLARQRLLMDHLEKRHDLISDPLFPQRVEKMYKENKLKHEKTD